MIYISINHHSIYEDEDVMFEGSQKLHSWFLFPECYHWIIFVPFDLLASHTSKAFPQYVKITCYLWFPPSLIVNLWFGLLFFYDVYNLAPFLSLSTVKNNLFFWHLIKYLSPSLIKVHCCCGLAWPSQIIKLPAFYPSWHRSITFPLWQLMIE